jgi:4-carboxymuconolactone decarboxylase
MPRIELITGKDQLAEERHSEIDEIVGVLGHVPGPFGVLLHSPGLAERVCKTGAHVRLQSELTMAEREIALLSVARDKDAESEWAWHAPIARKAGVSPEAMDVIRDAADPAGLPAEEREIVVYVRELLRTNRVRQETFDALRTRHGVRWLVELTATIGQYLYVTAINNAFETAGELKPDAERLPVPAPGTY